MSNTKSSEENTEINRPSTSQSSELPPLRSISSHNNTMNEANKTSKSVNSPNSGPSAVSFNSDVINGLAKQCDNINISNNKVNDQKSSTNSPKKKNVRKRENKLQLKIPSENTPSRIQSAPPVPSQNGHTLVHEIFLKQITPLYASTSTRHLFPGLDYIIPDEEFKKREDCTKMCIFSIDPFNCRDIDDAVSCRKLENGNYEIGVHISDVAHFLTENTLLDEIVAEKATTIYMVQRAYHMLPDELCMLCSLFPGVNKLAFSVFWEITEDAVVLSHRFAKTVINSCSQLAYEHAQAVLENKEDAEKSFPEIYNGLTYQDIYNTIKILGKISAIFRKKRFSEGALRIDQPKVSFHLNTDNGLPDSYWIYDSKESHQLIEEFMLLANMTVAKRIHEDHPKLAFLRCHPPPSPYMLNQLAKSLKPMGIDIEISCAGDLHKSLLPYLSPDIADRGKAMVLNMLFAKPMTRAKYFCAGVCDGDEDFHHYALNVPLYTHFTSPIRRYADIMVHRLLAASLNYREPLQWEVRKVGMVAAQCNKQKYNAKKAGELSTELYTLKYIEMHSPLITEAVVVEVRERYIDVIIVAMGLNRRIFFNNDFPGTYKCIKNDLGAKLSKMEVKWDKTDKLPAVEEVIEVFSILKVEMHKGDDMVKVETKLVRPQ
ncbi:jg25310 [Pararge aegeria aegeria]|uniref:Jg25310 protein n=2 Tax=Pararge aegeria TaxID=116150 RepID=A0A8S4RZF6_9NEOP|nr:jg25310 [Pararge aegeria aegeria]